MDPVLCCDPKTIFGRWGVMKFVASSSVLQEEDFWSWMWLSFDPRGSGTQEVNAGNQRLKMLLEQAQKAKDSNYSLSFLALSGLIIIIVQGNLWNKMEHNLHLLLQCFHLPFCFPLFSVLCLFVLLFSLVLAPCIPKGF